ncbi:MAG TPA: Holliday junction resolvase-like protein [Micropepsaceae bacterium]|nr:Holliday junction resolvase-like protein [Micropepsaceae bacterium]
MTLISELKQNRRLYGTCPSCSEEFRIAEVTLFPAGKKWPAEAMARFAEEREENKLRRQGLREIRSRMTQGCAVTTESIHFGKMLEKVAPSFEAFAFQPRDCRALSDPIDYLVFSGLSQKGSIESLTFVDVKTGAARLNRRQKKISEAVSAGRVALAVIDENRKLCDAG